MIVESSLTEDRLLASLQSLLADDSRRSQMGERARSLAHPDAVRQIGQMVTTLAR